MAITTIALQNFTIVSAADVEETKSVPSWAYEAMDDLSAAGMIDTAQREACRDAVMSREDMVLLVARALRKMEVQPGEYKGVSANRVEKFIGPHGDRHAEAIERLKREFMEELRDMGYGAVEFAGQPVVADESKIKISGEVRYNYAANEGPRPTTADDSLLRTRLFADAALNEDWSAHMMLESNKSFLRDGRSGRIKWNRFYVQRKTNESLMRAGSFGYLMAEGNIYDSTFKGAFMEFGDPVKYRLGRGRTNDNGMGSLFSASYRTQDYDAESGLYRFRDNALREQRTIGYLGGKYLLGRYRLGAMYLYSSQADRGGERDGYVLNVEYGAAKDWKPGSYSLFARYYDQAQGTYIAHTMVGPAGYMAGFKGYGAGVYYTVAVNLVYGMEYYDIRDKVTGARGRTLWNQITFYF